MSRARFQVELAWVVVGVFVAGFAASWLPGVGDAWRSALAAVPGRTPLHTWATYPLAYRGADAGELLGLFWVWFIVRMVEPRLGWKGVAGALAGGAAASAGAAAAVLPWTGPTALFGPAVPAAMLTAYAAAHDPRREVYLFGALRIAMLWIGVAAVGLLVVNYGAGDPLRGFAVALPSVAFWLWGSGKVRRPERRVQSGRGGMAKSPKEFDEFLAKVREKERRREEEETLRRLLERPPQDPGEPRTGPGE
jgi:hypothetical protein